MRRILALAASIACPCRRPARRREDPSLVEPGRLPHRRPDGAERAAHQLDQRPRLRMPRDARQEARDPARARRRAGSRPSPTMWIFNLRKGVKFHDGSPFTADDVVFSIKRLQGPTSNFRVYGNAVGDAAQDRRLHRRVHHAGAQPGDARDARQQPLHDEQELVREEQRREDAGLHQQGGEPTPSRNAMGTGPYILVSREPGREERLQEEPQLVGTQGEQGLLRRQRRRDRLHADQVRGHAHGGAPLRRPRLHPRPAGAGHRAS